MSNENMKVTVDPQANNKECQLNTEVSGPQPNGKFRINKKLAIEAIRTEPILKPETWFHTNGTFQISSMQEAMSCAVCAVGSVLRANCFIKSGEYQTRAITKMMIGDYFAASDHRWWPDGIIGNYLGNLSALFEFHTNGVYNALDPDSQEVRDILIRHIEEKWPESFDV